MNWNEEELEMFWRFIVDRQSIWVRKLEQRAKPWSGDPVLQSSWFTNVYRELDPGTEWMVANILDNDELKSPSKAFWCLLYRYCGSNRHAWEGVDLVPVGKYRPKAFARSLDRSGDPWGRAYLVYPMTNEPTKLSKTQLVADAFGELAGRWTETYRAAKKAGTAKTSYLVIRNCRTGVADFTAYQGWLDMLYPNGERKQLLRWSRNDYVVAGPGALKGLSNLAGHDINATKQGQTEARDRIDWLWENQRKEMLALGLKMEWLVDNKGQPQMLWKSDIQNCCCEWSKYVRIRDTGKITRKYTGGS